MKTKHFWRRLTDHEIGLILAGLDTLEEQQTDEVLLLMNAIKIKQNPARESTLKRVLRQEVEEWQSMIAGIKSKIINNQKHIADGTQ